VSGYPWFGSRRDVQGRESVDIHEE